MSPINTATEIRHYILVILDKALPVGASDKLLSISLAGISLTVSDSELEIQLGYLKEKGYITYEKIKDRHSKISRKIARLTAKGIDLVEGNIDPDPGIGLSRE